jgi:hypothetical protein
MRLAQQSSWIPSGRIVAELPPGLPQSDWCVADETVRGGDIPHSDRWP